MADLVNLRAARKRKEREGKEATAAANRAAFGRTKSEKAVTKAKQMKESKHLDAHRRDE